MKVSCEPDNLAGLRSVGIVERIGVKNGGNARALLIAGRRVERERQVKPVGALVLDQALLDRPHLRRRIGNVGDRRRWLKQSAASPAGAATRFSQRSRKSVRRIGRRLMPGEKRSCVRPGEGKKSLVGSLIAAKQAFGFQRLEIEPIEEGPIPVGRRASPGKVRSNRRPGEPPRLRSRAGASPDCRGSHNSRRWRDPTASEAFAADRRRR